MASRKTLEQALENPNVRKFLDLLAYTEGTTGNGYRTAFGGGRLESLADHPRYLKTFKQTNGKTNKTSAAGRYQFLKRTWDNLASQYGLKDFGPRNQDLGAIALLIQNGALPYILKGDWGNAVAKSGGTWASLPSSPHPQPTKSWKKVNNFLGGKINLTDIAKAGSDSTKQDSTSLTDDIFKTEDTTPDYAKFDADKYRNETTSQNNSDDEIEKHDSIATNPLNTNKTHEDEVSELGIAKPQFTDNKLNITKQDWGKVAEKVFGSSTPKTTSVFDFNKPITRAISGVIKEIV